MLLRKIMKIGDEIRRLEQDVAGLQSVDIVSYPENYNSLSMQAAISSEFICRKLRELVFSTTNISLDELMCSVADAMDIKIELGCNGIVNITIPCLIPGRKKKSIEFITAPLYAALDRFALEQEQTENPLERFENCVICITHVYDSSLYDKRRKRDHDNVETKGIVDIINSFLLTDDSQNFCDIYNTSEVSDADYTRISIMKKDMFPKWILDTKMS